MRQTGRGKGELKRGNFLKFSHSPNQILCYLKTELQVNLQQFPFKVIKRRGKGGNMQI